MTIPSFMMIGVAKAGTTSFFRYLDQHPQIFMCPIKGTNYFAYEDVRDSKWTNEGDRNFPVKTFEAYERAFAGASNEIAIGEVCPIYLRCANVAAQRIHERIPNAKLVVSLRNPAERAFSGLMMRKRRGEVVKGVYEELTLQSGHVKNGFYHERLKRYLDIFPKDQIKIYIFEEFKKDPAKIVADLYGFLGVDTTFAPDTSTRHNVGAIPKVRLLNRVLYNRSLIRIAKSMVPEGLHMGLKKIRRLNLSPPAKLPADLRSKLLNLYRKDILKLEALLDRDLSIWCSAS
ncbi:MAG: sulfotransferase family protein [Gammaproteobacteria bacterium]